MFFFFFNDTATTEIYTLSLHDALPILPGRADVHQVSVPGQGHQVAGQLAVIHPAGQPPVQPGEPGGVERSEEHTSELQSRQYLVCRLLLEKKKKSDDATVRATESLLLL